MTRGSTASPTASLRWRTAVFTLSAPRLLLIFRRPLEMIRVFSPTRHGIPLLAIAMVSFAGWSIAAKHDPRVAASTPIAAPTNPYDDNVAGTGIVEPASEVIALAIERGGVVSGIDVMAGDRVKVGQPLFAIDDRDYRAAVAQGEAAVAAAKASIATIDQSLILQHDAIDQARAALASAEQQIEVLSAQRKEAEAKLGQAKATLDQARVDLDKTVVKASIDGAILKVNVRLGEYAQAGVLSDPLMTMGSVDPLHV